jgi:hypothetical protein
MKLNDLNLPLINHFTSREGQFTAMEEDIREERDTNMASWHGVHAYNPNTQEAKAGRL